jgi:MoaA/NifB/PqqE/SkfB family radical SAM enzyme
MDIKDLIFLLEEKFIVKGFADIGELSQSPGAAMTFFHNLYQKEYHADDRIVIYSSQAIPNNVLVHLYQTCNFLDISNWFVLVCSPTDVGDQLKNVAITSSEDPVPFQNLVTNIISSVPIENNYKLPESICAIPWLNIVIDHNGIIHPCCGSNDILGHISTDKLTAAFHGPKITEIRQQFLQGERPAGCSNCWDKEDQGLSSIRTFNATRLKKSFLTKYLTQPKIASYDLKFNNTCNFKCRICNPTASSMFAQENSKFKNIQLITQLNWSEDDKFIDQTNQLLPDITNIDMYGGEPFLIKKFSDILHTAVHQGYAKNIRLHYNSNGSVWPEKFLPYWKNFNHVDINFSIDAIGKRFELQRGGTWQAVEANILRLKNLDLPNMSLSIMPTISIMNIYYINEVLEWAEKHKFPIFVNYVVTPAEFELESLTASAKEIILQKFQNYDWPEMKNILKKIQSINTSDGKKFIETTKWFDQIRQENFADSHPEIAKAMGYI